MSVSLEEFEKALEKLMKEEEKIAAKIDWNDVNSLGQFLNDKNISPYIRFKITKKLGQLGGTESIHFLIKALEDSNTDVWVLLPH